MREIKFRAWNGEQMQYSCLIAGAEYFNALGILADEEFAKKTYGVKEWKVMQYTGLEDSQGVEIWEQDIVQRGDELSVVEYDSWHGDWEEGGATYGFYLPWMPISSTPVTVVGNIFEHPELKAQTIK